MTILDTNVLIRFLTNDDEILASQAEKLFRAAPQKSLKLFDVIFIEVIFVLQSVYQLEKNKIVEIVALLIGFPAISCDGKLLGQTLRFFSQYPISIVDAYLLARAALAPDSQLMTYDKKLKKLANELI